MNNLSYISKESRSSNSIWLLIRHSEKIQPPDDKPFLDCGLTKDGHKDAVIFGEKVKQKLSQSLKGIYSSPLKRCVETSEAILKGIEEEIEIQKSKFLGDPGPYIFSEPLARGYFLTNQHKNIVKMQVDGIKMEGFRNVNEGSSVLMEYILNRQSSKGLYIFVTHDVIIAALVGYLIGYILDESNWIKYLQGACFYNLVNRIMMNIPEGQFDLTDKIKYFLSLRKDVIE